MAKVKQATETISVDVAGFNGKEHSANGTAQPLAPSLHDPIIALLAALDALPETVRETLFADFREAADSKDLRRLQDTISDWFATAEIYAQPKLAAEVQAAIGGRREVADWLNG